MCLVVLGIRLSEAFNGSNKKLLGSGALPNGSGAARRTGCNLRWVPWGHSNAVRSLAFIRPPSHCTSPYHHIVLHHRQNHHITGHPTLHHPITELLTFYWFTSWGGGICNWRWVSGRRFHEDTVCCLTCPLRKSCACGNGTHPHQNFSAIHYVYLSAGVVSSCS